MMDIHYKYLNKSSKVQWTEPRCEREFPFMAIGPVVAVAQVSEKDHTWCDWGNGWARCPICGVTRMPAPELSPAT